MKTLSGRTSRAPRPWLGALITVVCFCSGCSTVTNQPATAEQQVALLKGAGLLSATAIAEAELPSADSLLEVDDTMRQFAIEATRGKGASGDRARALANALGEQGLGLRYDPGATLSVRDVFYERRANCLSFSMLYVALARSVGIDAYFNDVEVPALWDRSDEEQYLLYRHINVRADKTGKQAPIVDIAASEYDLGYPQRIISDKEAIAQFYNNRAIELRLQGKRHEALPYQIRALQITEDKAYLWSNLASLYLALGKAEAARQAVGTALNIDPTELASYGTAAHVYTALGRPEDAAYCRKLAQRFQLRNPYYHYQLAVVALREGAPEEAYRAVRRAIELNPQEHRFLFVLGVTLLELDQPDLANQALALAVDMSQDSAQGERYRNKFAALAASHRG